MALIRKYIPVVKTGGLTEQMPLPYQRSTITVGLEYFWKGLLTAIKVSTVFPLTILVRIFTRKNYRATGTSN